MQRASAHLTGLHTAQHDGAAGSLPGAVLDGAAEESAVVRALRESMAKDVLGDAGFAFGGPVDD